MWGTWPLITRYNCKIAQKKEGGHHTPHGLAVVQGANWKCGGLSATAWSRGCWPGGTVRGARASQTPHKHKKIPTPPAPQRSHPAPTHGHHRAGPIPTPPEIKQAPCFEARQPLLHPPARPRSQNPPNHRNHQPHHSTHQPRPAALGWAPSHPARLTRPPTDQKDRLSTRTHLFRPPRRAAGRACRAARLGRGSGSCTRNRAGGGPGVGSWLGFAP